MDCFEHRSNEDRPSYADNARAVQLAEELLGIRKANASHWSLIAQSEIRVLWEKQ